jgi:hypothetical protein
MSELNTDNCSSADQVVPDGCSNLRCDNRKQKHRKMFNLNQKCVGFLLPIWINLGAMQAAYIECISSFNPNDVMKRIPAAKLQNNVPPNHNHAAIEKFTRDDFRVCSHCYKRQHLWASNLVATQKGLS